MMYILVALIVLVTYYFLWICERKLRHVREAKRRGCLPAASVPSDGFFGLGTLRQSIRATKAGYGPQWMHNSLDEVGKHVHTVRARIFDYELLITRDTENAKAIFNTQGADFDIGSHREGTSKSVFGLGVMTARGKEWKHSRALIRPQFARGNVANLPMFEKHFQSLLKKLKVDNEGWTDQIDLQPLFQSFTLDTGTEFLYGQSVFSQDPEARARLPLSWDKDGPDIANFGHHLDKVKGYLDRQGALAKYNWLLRSHGFDQHRKEIWKFVDYFVRKALLENDEEKRVQTSDTMQGRFVLLNELVKETRNPLELRNETLNVLHAS